jgi:hypothetical protein
MTATRCLYTTVYFSLGTLEDGAGDLLGVLPVNGSTRLHPGGRASGDGLGVWLLCAVSRARRAGERPG